MVLAIGFLHKFIPNCAEILKPLMDLTGKNKPDKVVWQSEHHEAFDKVKLVLTSEPVLKQYRRDMEHVLQTDTFYKQIAVTLLPREEDVELHPVIDVYRWLLSLIVTCNVPANL